MSRDTAAMHGREHADMNRGEVAPLQYEMRGMGHSPEDILFCVDADAEVNTEMKAGGAKGLGRLDAIKQALILFVHSKLLLYSQHRFAFATLRNSATWHVAEFTNDMDIIGTAVRSLSFAGTFARCDLSDLFRMAAAAAHSSHALDRTVRVVLIYCRSSVVPEFTVLWPEKQRLFTFDAMYLHEKPNRDNCPQRVYDVLVDALERVSEFEGYIFESSSGSARVLFRHMCVLLSHAQQRCAQDEFDAPKDLAKSVVAIPGTAAQVACLSLGRREKMMAMLHGPSNVPCHTELFAKRLTYNARSNSDCSKYMHIFSFPKE